MNNKNVEQEILKILSESVLKGSNRELALDKPIGEAGLGLDSMSMVEFVLALEEKFNIEFPESIWTNRDLLTLDTFINHIKKNKVSKVKVIRKRIKIIKMFDVTPKKKITKVIQVIHNLGIWSGLLWSISMFLYRKEVRYILLFDLKSEKAYKYSSEINLSFSIATQNDLNNINKMIPNLITRDQFINRLKSGYICYLAWYKDEVVACDWIAEEEHFDHNVGLTFIMKDNSCYGFELYEKNDFKRMGVGLALLSFSLEDCKNRDYKYQFTWVNSENLKMLNASVQILGFKKIGEIYTKKILSKPFSKWLLDEDTYRNNLIIK